MHSVLVVIQYILEYLHQAENGQAEVANRKVKFCCAYRKVRVNVSLPESMACQRQQLQTLRKINCPLSILWRAIVHKTGNGK